MPFVQFLGLALIGSAVWSFAFVGIGYGLGASYKSFEHDFRYVEYAIVAGIVSSSTFWLPSEGYGESDSAWRRFHSLTSEPDPSR